jgi:hypothetical protein
MRRAKIEIDGNTLRKGFTQKHFLAQEVLKVASIFSEITVKTWSQESMRHILKMDRIFSHR